MISVFNTFLVNSTIPKIYFLTFCNTSALKYTYGIRSHYMSGIGFYFEIQIFFLYLLNFSCETFLTHSFY